MRSYFRAFILTIKIILGELYEARYGFYAVVPMCLLLELGLWANTPDATYITLINETAKTVIGSCLILTLIVLLKTALEMRKVYKNMYVCLINDPNKNLYYGKVLIKIPGKELSSAAQFWYIDIEQKTSCIWLSNNEFVHIKSFNETIFDNTSKGN